MMERKKIYTVFPEGKYKALTLSYDDGREEDKRLISIFRKYGLKATFNLNSGLSNTDPKRIRKEEWPELYDGFEIAAHTATHPTISRCPLSFVAEEILKDREELEKVTGYPVRDSQGQGRVGEGDRVSRARTCISEWIIYRRYSEDASTSRHKLCPRCR